MSNLQPIGELDYDDNEQREGMEVIQLVGLKLGEEEYAIDVLKIQEIIRTVEITSVPRTEGFVLGVMNLRGKVIPVIDLRIRFSLDKMDFDKETRIIVVRFETENIGFVVDEVTEVIRINKSMVEPTPPLVGTVGQEYILGICKYAERLIILLDIDSVVSDDKNIESDLKKTILGQVALPSAEQNYQQIASAVEKEYAEPEDSGQNAIGTDTQGEDAIEEGSADDDVGASIDDLIALELSKREAETDELNKKKHEEEAAQADSKKKPEAVDNLSCDLDDILNDALNQSGSKMESEEGHVEQNELDDLIAIELNKREAETEALKKKKKTITKIATEEPEEEPQSDPAAEEPPYKESNSNSDTELDETDKLSVNDKPLAEEPTAESSDNIEDLIEAPADNEEININKQQDELLLNDQPEPYLTDEKPEEEATHENLENILPVEAPEEKVEESLLEEIHSEQTAEPSETIQPAEDANPMDELKSISAQTVGSSEDSFDKLKTLSKKIIDGEAVDIGIDLKSEISELLKLILDTKQRVDEIEPTLATSKEHLPNVLSTLESVTESTEDATFSLMENADSLNNFYQEFVEEINDLEDLIYKKDVNNIVRKIEKLENNMEEADKTGFNILHALEFQDITEQKIQKVISSISDIGARLGAILGFIKLKQVQDPTVADDASQDDIDKLLAEFGLD